MRLRQQGHIEDVFSLSHLVEGNLVGEDRLAGTRNPLEDVDAAVKKAAGKDPVQARDAAGEPLKMRGERVGAHGQSRYLPRQRRCEGGTGAGTTLNRDIAAARERELAGDPQPQPEARAISKGLGAREAIEDVRLIFL